MSGEAKKSLKSVIFAGIVTLVLAGCAKANLVNSNSVFQDGIEYYLQTDKAVYDLGEDVETLYRVTNLRDETWSVTAFIPVMVIIVEEREGENFNEIWPCEQYTVALYPFHLGPNAYADISVIWPQIDTKGTWEIEDDTQVSPGIYRISGSFHSCSALDSRVAVDITIIPEPSSLVLFVGGLLIVKYFNEKRGRLKNERGRKEKDEERGLCRDSYFSSGRMRKGKSR